MSPKYVSFGTERVNIYTQFANISNLSTAGQKQQWSRDHGTSKVAFLYMILISIDNTEYGARRIDTTRNMTY